MSRLVFTRESLVNLEQIYAYSCNAWGELVADRYQQALLESLKVVEQYPSLLKQCDFSDTIRIYFAEKHTLFFTVTEEEIILLAVRYGAMDVQKIIAELEPLIALSPLKDKK